MRAAAAVAGALAAFFLLSAAAQAVALVGAVLVGRAVYEGFLWRAPRNS